MGYAKMFRKIENYQIFGFLEMAKNNPNFQSFKKFYKFRFNRH